jgi:sugar lactone lactonase YvrE
VWADLGDGVPDGICIDADGAVWYATFPNPALRAGGRRWWGDQTVDLDRGCFACMLGGADGRTPFMMAGEWRGPDAVADAMAMGQVVTARAPAPHAGWP